MREEYQKEQTNVQPASQPLAPVYNNGWNGSVRQVTEWLKDNLALLKTFLTAWFCLTAEGVGQHFEGGFGQQLARFA
jgi:hypothetical protein